MLMPYQAAQLPALYVRTISLIISLHSLRVKTSGSGAD